MTCHNMQQAQTSRDSSGPILSQGTEHQCTVEETPISYPDETSLLNALSSFSALFFVFGRPIISISDHQQTSLYLDTPFTAVLTIIFKLLCVIHLLMNTIFIVLVQLKMHIKSFLMHVPPKLPPQMNCSAPSDKTQT